MYVYVSSRCVRLAARIPSTPLLRSALIPLAIGFLVAAAPAVLRGQSAGPLSDRSSLGLAGGVFKYEPSDDSGSPIFSVRLDRPMSRWTRLELGTSYTRPEIQADAEGFFDPTLPAEHTNLFAVTAGIQARLTVGPIEPYAGLSVGFFGRYEGGPAGRSFGRSTFQFPLGIRIWATDHLGVRGEYRFDEDRHEVFTHSDSEIAAGVFWTF
jgi:hypothetical protein